MSSSEYSGRRLRGAEFDGFRVDEVLSPAGTTVPLHAHASGQIAITLRGEGVEERAGQLHRLTPGVTILRAPGQPHANRFGPVRSTVTLLVSFEPLRFPILSQTAYRHTLLLGEIGFEIAGELRRPGVDARWAVEGLTLLLAARAARLDPLAPAEPSWLQDAVDYLETAWREPLTLRLVGARVGVHPATLAAAFRRHRQCSVFGMVNRLRVRHAIRELEESDKPLGDIAVGCGFYDQSHMGKLIRRHTGATPARLRLGRRRLLMTSRFEL